MNPIRTIGEIVGSNRRCVPDAAERIVRCPLLCFVLLALSWTPSAATDQRGEAPTARIVGLGAATCSQFMADVAANPPMRRDYLAWAQGFIILSRPPGVDQGLDPAAFGLLDQLRSRLGGRVGSVCCFQARPERSFHLRLRGYSILAALANAVFLLVATGAIGWESVQRFWNPEPVAVVSVMAVATAGIFVNGATALLFAAGRKGDMNIRGAFLHMAGDAAVSAGVVVSAAMIIWTEWLWLDPAMSLVICFAVLLSTWGLLRGSVDMALNTVPGTVDLVAVRTFLVNRPGVTGIHDLHIWPISKAETAMTCYLVMPAGPSGRCFPHGCLPLAQEELQNRPRNAAD